MHVEVDQSGKIGNGQQDVVLVCTLDWVCLCGKEIACSQIGIGYFSWGTASRPEGDRGDDTRQILDKKRERGRSKAGTAWFGASGQG